MPLFLLANTDDDLLDDGLAEIVLMASAFEQFRSVSGGKKALECANQISSVMGIYGSTICSSVSCFRTIGYDSKHESEQKAWPLHKKWMKEFYESRNNIVHGGERKSAWTLQEHLVMGAVVFPLLCKLELATEDLYVLTETDVALCSAIDHLLAVADWHSPCGASSKWQDIIRREGRDNSKRGGIQSHYFPAFWRNTV